MTVLACSLQVNGNSVFLDYACMSYDWNGPVNCEAQAVGFGHSFGEREEGEDNLLLITTRPQREER